MSSGNNKTKTPAQKRVAKAEERRIKALEGRRAKALYNRRKDAVIEKERENFQKLYLVRTHDKYGWKMFSHSALIYAWYVAPRLERQVKMKEDDDFVSRKKVESVMIKSLETLAMELKTVLGIEPEYNRDGLAIFDLKKEFTKSDLNEARSEFVESWDEANKLVEVESSMYPMLSKALYMTAKMIAEIVRKFDSSAFSLVGDRMIRTIGEMEEEFMMTMKGRGEMKLKDCLEFLMDKSYRLESQLKIICDEKLIHASRAIKIAYQIQELEKRIGDAIKKEARANANA